MPRWLACREVATSHFLLLSLQVASILGTDKRCCVVSVWFHLWVYRQSLAPTVIPRTSVIHPPFKGPASDDPGRFPIAIRVGRLEVLRSVRAESVLVETTYLPPGYLTRTRRLKITTSELS